MKTCHPDFGCSCVEVAQLKIEKGQTLVVIAPGCTPEDARAIQRTFVEALYRARGEADIPVLVSPIKLELTVLEAEAA